MRGNRKQRQSKLQVSYRELAKDPENLMERGNGWIKLPGLRMWDSNASKFPRSSEARTLPRYSFVDRIKDLTAKRKGLKKKPKLK